VGGVARRDLSRGEIGADDAFRGAGALDLGDHRRLAETDFCPDRADEVARRRPRPGFGAQGGIGLRRPRGGDFLALDGEDFLENVGHGEP
jgi:hypothetical protein